MTAGNKIRKVGLFCCVAFVAVWTTNAQPVPEHIGVDQPVHEDAAQAHYLFYFRTIVLLFASAGAWLFSRCRRPQRVPATRVFQMAEAIKQRDIIGDVPTLRAPKRDPVKAISEPEILLEKVPIEV